MFFVLHYLLLCAALPTRKDKLLKSENLYEEREIQPLTLFKMCLWLVWECIKVAKVFIALIFDLFNAWDGKF